MPESSPPGDPRVDPDRISLFSGTEASKPNGETHEGADADPTRPMDVIPETEAPPADPLRDRLLGEFHLLRRLGSGGMADVYLAEQTTLKRLVAVKVLRADSVSDESHLQRFEREAKAAAGLNHPNIVQVYVIGEDEGTHYIAQEYVQGLNLREFLTRKGTPSLPVALHIMKQVAQALEAAGEAGIVHRDIKPENIMITRKGEVKVADFGLAQLNRGDERLHLTQVGVTMGTPLYMSPEQVNGKKLDSRSDLYSFGVTCYHMLAGRPPFRGETALSVAVQHLNAPPEPLHERRPDLPRPLCDMIHRMMSKDPAKRQPNAKSLLHELKRLQRSVKADSGEWELSFDDFSPASLPSGRFASWPYRFPGRLGRRALAFILILLAVGSASAVVGWIRRPGNPLDAPIQETVKIDKLDNAVDQYMLAMRLVDNEEAWKAVGEYFPDAELQKRRANEQLAYLYLSSHRLNDAASIYQQFAVTNNDLALKAKGLAGLAVVASLRGEHDRSMYLIEVELQPVIEHLDDEMRRLVGEAFSRNRQALGDKVKEGLEKLFETPELPENST